MNQLPPQFPEGTFANIPKIYIDWEWASLLERRFHAETFEIDCSELRLIRDHAGRFNLLSLRALKNPPPAPPPSSGESRPVRFHIDNFILTLGSATYTDLSGEAPVQKSYNLRLDHSVYRNVDSAYDVVWIIGWEALKRMGVGGMDQMMGAFSGASSASGAQGLIGSAISAIKAKI